MAHDFNKEPHNTNELPPSEKKKIPIFILIVVGVFLAAFIFYMLADREPQPGEVPANTDIPAVQQNQDRTATDSSVVNTTSAIAEDTATATAQ